MQTFDCTVDTIFRATNMTDLSKKFVTQSELDDRRKKRQEEWDKKRGENDPLGMNLKMDCFKEDQVHM